MKSIVVFASGGGSNFKSIFESTKSQKIKDTNINLLVSNNPDSGAVSYAKNQNIETFILNSHRYPDRDNYICAIVKKINQCKPDLIVLAGYMKLIPKELISLYEKKIINIHPGKLPEFGGKGFYGMNVHRAVIESGVGRSAVTIHYVNEEYDKGMIINEESVLVKNNDSPESLAKRVLLKEHEVYSKVINNLLNG